MTTIQRSHHAGARSHAERWWSSVGGLSLWGALLLLGTASEASVATRGNRGEGTEETEKETPASTAARERQRWQEQELTVVLDESLTELTAPLDEIVKAAFAEWQDTGAALPQVSFVQGKSSLVSLKPDGQNTILVAPITFKGHETDLAITVGFSNSASSEISEADIIINADHLFKVISAEEAELSCVSSPVSTLPSEQESCTGSLDSSACSHHYDLQNVLTHEVGHFFGLGENYDDTRATMFSCTSACELHKRDLNPADVEEITTLYQTSGLDEVAGCAGAQVGGRPSSLHLGPWMLAGIIAVATFGRRNRARS